MLLLRYPVGLEVLIYIHALCMHAANSLADVQTRLSRCCSKNVISTKISYAGSYYYPPTKWEGYCASVCPSIPYVCPSVLTFCPFGTISQYLFVRFYSFLVQMISTIDSQYHLSFVKIDHSTLELLPLFSVERKRVGGTGFTR